MKDSMFTQLAEIIHSHRTWIAVHDTKRIATVMAHCGASLKPVKRRMLTLVATHTQGVYHKGHVWDIPEDKLDRAVRSLKQRDKQFGERWNQDKLTVADAEALVKHASNSFLILNLNEENQ
jgi:hypothetical protein